MRRTPVRLAALSALTVGALALSGGAALAQDGQVDEPSSFTSMFTVMATPDMVIGQNNQPAPGQPGATGSFDYRINSDEEVICYDLRLEGVTGEYQSPARTATHIHEAASGASGPPRIAFPNPSGDGDTRTSSGCLQGPFTTGVMANGQDSGAGFSLKQIEANPSAFFGDTHTAGFTAGTVRGQLTPVPMGGVETGAGGADDSAAPIALGAAAVVAAGAAGVVAFRRSRA
ncbi:CHRD domain-containing protein [Actinomycetospora termitidis]|uniref:CHRD domain-containing protein n=1 Tax=Actinomycetospora termitidis TaxID=3053470 RepID=A0ABT7MCM8_9PSEU|nr:CHRD domain-containing protein [Actinomycetospora sp. Odt1-22]MDL5157138.1 CHRD domain-containing protein [Actinomycetospora sp. Odt1-22]